jgi:hypothetical protein
MQSSESEVLMLSMILNLVVDGKANLANLSPHVKDYILGLLDEYETEVEQGEGDVLYWYAHTMLEEISGGKKILH